MTLRDQILARIDETPHRAPTHLSIVQSLYPQARACIDAELRAMLADRVIDTENGDSGLTYLRAKAPYVAPEKKAPATEHESIKPWPKKSTALTSPSADCIDKCKARIAATKERIRAVLTVPMTVSQYAEAAGIKLNPANQMLQRYAEIGFLAVERKRPFCYRVAT